MEARPRRARVRRAVGGLQHRPAAGAEAESVLDRSVTCLIASSQSRLFRYSFGFVALPGGVGTIDELFEAVTLIQTGKIRQFPVVLMGKTYWRPLTDLLGRMAADGAISAQDLQLVFVTDSVEEAIDYLERNAIDRFALRAPRPSPWLGESRRVPDESTTAIS